MKYCTGKYHGDVQKAIGDDEEYCLICRQRMAGVKEENAKKTKSMIFKIAQLGVPIILTTVSQIILGKFNKGGGKSKTGGKRKS